MSAARRGPIKLKTPRGSAILMPGGNVPFAPTIRVELRLNYNQLVRTRHAYRPRARGDDHGLSTDLASAVQYMAAIKRPVTVIGTSRSTCASGARGARPDALVLTSGFQPGTSSRENDGDPVRRGAVGHAGDPSGRYLPRDHAAGRPLHQMGGRAGARRPY
jgi:hypothetical protein